MRACWAPPWSSTASRRQALAAYDAKLCGPISQLVLRNRGAGPFGLLNMVDERCGGTFDNIDDVIPPQGARRVHGGLQGGGGICDRKAERSPPTIASGASARGIALAV